MSSMDVNKNRYVAIKHHMKNGVPEELDFELKTEPFPLSNEAGEKDVIVKTLFLSIDPYIFNRMKNKSSSFQPIKFSGAILPGKAIDGQGVGRVVVSGDPSFKEGDLVTGLLSWGDYTRIKQGTALNKLDTMGLPLSYYSGGILGSSGLTAYAGFFELCKPKKGEKVFVSAASGSVGNLVGQYAKLFGCYVVGCAGSKEKVKLLKEKLGFDEAFNYKEETDLNSALKRYFPDGIDIYFDNVGGEMLEAAIENMNAFGRVTVCGAISEYTDENKRAAPNMLDVIYKRIAIRGFLSTDHMNAYNDFVSATVGYLREGKMQVIEDISDGLESLPSAFVSLFRGGNVGKKIVRVADD